jgi:hypothetical protein
MAERVVVLARVHSDVCALRRLKIDAFMSESAPSARDGDDTSPSMSDTVYTQTDTDRDTDRQAEAETETETETDTRTYMCLYVCARTRGCKR